MLLCTQGSGQVPLPPPLFTFALLHQQLRFTQNLGYTRSKALDTAEAPETGRVLLVVLDTYMLLKQCTDIAMQTNIGNELRLKGVVGMLDGMPVVRVPASRVPKNFGFMVAHSLATVATTKLASYRVHTDPPGINGSLVEGRIVYDAFVLENKKKALHYQAIPEA